MPFYDDEYIGASGPFYADAFFNNLEATPPLNETEIAVLRQGLEAAALAWHRTKSEPSIDRNKCRAEFREIAKLSRRTAKKLRSVPDDVWALLAGVDVPNEDLPRVFADPLGGFGPPEFAITAERGQGFEGGDLTCTIGDLATLLESLDWVAFEAEFEVPSRMGPAPDLPIRRWIFQVGNLWSELKRPFTRDFDKTGAPISDAARFCVAAYAVLDPKTPTSRIANEMKKLIKAGNRSHS